MALVFTDWEHCTDDVTGDVYVLDWTSEDALNKRLLRPYYEAIRQAILERNFGFSVNPKEMSRETQLLKDFNVFYDEIDAFLTNYIVTDDWNNHPSGVVRDLDNKPPHWTKESLLAYLGYTEEYRTVLPLAKSMWQMYRMINACYIVREDGTLTSFYDRTAYGLTFSDAVSNWNAASWVPKTTGIPEHFVQHLNPTDPTQPEYRITRTSARYGVAFDGRGYGTLWKIFAAFEDPDGSYGTPEYENNDYSVGDFTWREIKNGHLPAGITGIGENIGRFDVVTGTAPGAKGAVRGWQTIPAGIDSNPFSTFNYYAPDGFVFQGPTYA